MGELSEGYDGVWRGGVVRTRLAPRDEGKAHGQTRTVANRYGEIKLRIGNRTVVNGSVDGEL